MTSLQLGLIAAGIALVIGVLIYNWLQERRVRRRIDEAFRDTAPAAASDPETSGSATGRGSDRVEPTLAARDSSAMPENVAGSDVDSDDDDAGTAYEPPLAIQARMATDLATGEVIAEPVGAAAAASPVDRSSREPDPDIECVVLLQPVRPVTAGAIASGLHARLGKPLRWFGRSEPGQPWQRLKSDTAGQFSDIAACLLLADRSRRRRRAADRRVCAPCRQRRIVGSRGLRAARLRARGRARRSARPHLRRSRRADRPHGVEARTGDDSRNAPARRRRGGRFPARRKRPLRVGAGRDGRRALLARRIIAPSRSRSTRSGSRRRRVRSSCSTCRALPIRSACSTR